MTAYEEANYMK